MLSRHCLLFSVVRFFFFLLKKKTCFLFKFSFLFIDVSSVSCLVQVQLLRAGKSEKKNRFCDARRPISFVKPTFQSGRRLSVRTFCVFFFFYFKSLIEKKKKKSQHSD